MLLLAQAGVPFTAGFIAKFGVIIAAADAKEYLLAVVAMTSAVIAMFLYLRVTVSMYVSEPTEEAARHRIPVPLSAGIALVVAVGFTIAAGVVPGFLVDFAHDSVPGFALR